MMCDQRWGIRPYWMSVNVRYKRLKIGSFCSIVGILMISFSYNTSEIGHTTLAVPTPIISNSWWTHRIIYIHIQMQCSSRRSMGKMWYTYQKNYGGRTLFSFNKHLTWSKVIGASTTSNSFHSFDNSKIDALVTPGKIVVSNGGVRSSFPCDKKMTNRR